MCLLLSSLQKLVAGVVKLESLDHLIVTFFVAHEKTRVGNFHCTAAHGDGERFCWSFPFKEGYLLIFLVDKSLDASVLIDHAVSALAKNTKEGAFPSAYATPQSIVTLANHLTDFPWTIVPSLLIF